MQMATYHRILLLFEGIVVIETALYLVGKIVDLGLGVTDVVCVGVNNLDWIGANSLARIEVNNLARIGVNNHLV
jgi:hypothetical protein